MDMILLTKSSVPIIGQVASIMGWIMDGIYRVLDLVGIQNPVSYTHLDSRIFVFPWALSP